MTGLSLRSPWRQIFLLVTFSMLLFAGVFVFLLLYSILQGEDAINALAGLIGTPMEAKNAFEWSDKLLAVGIALAGSFTTVTIALSTFAVQKESEEAKSREALLADRALHQNVLDAVENLFRLADDKLVQISTLAFDLKKETKIPADNEWRDVRRHQQAFWDSVDSASRISTGNLTISGLWNAHYNRSNMEGERPHHSNGSFTDTYLRGTGMFGVDAGSKSVLDFDRIVKCLQSARADVNFEPTLWHYLARTVPDRYAISEKTNRRGESGSDTSTQVSDPHNYGVKKIKVPDDLLTHASPALSREVAHISGSFTDAKKLVEYNKFCRDAIKKWIPGQVLADVHEFTDKDLRIAAQEMLESFEDVQSALVEIVKITDANADFVKNVQKKVNVLSGLSFPGSNELARSRHTKKGDAWLVQLHVELAGMILVPDMMLMCCKTDSGKWTVNIGLAFILDLVRMYSSSFDSEFKKVGRANKRMSVPPLTLGFFTKSYLENSGLVKFALQREQKFHPSASSTNNQDLGTDQVWSSIGDELKLPELGGNPILEEIDTAGNIRNLREEVQNAMRAKEKELSRKEVELEELQKDKTFTENKIKMQRNERIRDLKRNHAKIQADTKSIFEKNLSSYKRRFKVEQGKLLISYVDSISTLAEVSSTFHRNSEEMAKVLADMELIFSSTEDADVSALAEAFLRGSAYINSNGILSDEVVLRKSLEKKIFSYLSETVPKLIHQNDSKKEFEDSLKEVESLQQKYSLLLEGAKQKRLALSRSENPKRDPNLENPFA